MADPLPQAFVLTAIVIAFSITIVMLVLAVTGRDDDDDAEAKPEEVRSWAAPSSLCSSHFPCSCPRCC